jgi:hypothetical protein
MQTGSFVSRAAVGARPGTNAENTVVLDRHSNIACGTGPPDGPK